VKIPNDVFYFKAEGEGNRCDFCSMTVAAGDPGKDYLCEPFSIPGPISVTMDGEWWACAPCAELIDADNWYALAQRAAQQVAPEFRDRCLVQVRALHQEFAKHRRKAQ
jgi:hypothetical protein